jgi:hypothetical protein
MVVISAVLQVQDLELELELEEQDQKQDQERLRQQWRVWEPELCPVQQLQLRLRSGREMPWRRLWQLWRHLLKVNVNKEGWTQYVFLLLQST